ncbi:MAG: trigger factor [Bacteroidetes bacterium]|jgi:trigger factor|nr:trigger factor [Bacteroidota bacterium]
MNISKENSDALNAVLKVTIEPSDYKDRVEHVLNDYRKKANLDGFRPGKVPMGLIKKKYYKPVLVDEVNKLMSESLTKYLIDEQLNILGEPLPSESFTPEVDWDQDEQFEFAFDIGLAPEVDITVSKKDKFTRYRINIDDELRNRYIDNYARRYGAFKEIDEVKDKEYLKAKLIELDENGHPTENGVSVEEGSISMEYMTDEESRNKMLGLKVGDKVVLDVKKAFPNEADLAGLLQIEKEQLDNINPQFEITLKSISVFEPSPIDQSLFDKIYGEGNVNSKEEFAAKIDEEISPNLEQEANWKLSDDIKQGLLKKVKLDLPEEFLKRWLYAVNKEKFTKEQIDEEFPKFAEDLKWQLVRDKLAKDYEIEVSEEEAKEVAKKVAQYQYMQYGMGNIPDEYLDNFATEMMKREEDKRRFYDQKREEKLIEKVKEMVKIDEKEISSEKFNKLVEK